MPYCIFVLVDAKAIAGLSVSLLGIPRRRWPALDLRNEAVAEHFAGTILGLSTGDVSAAISAKDGQESSSAFADSQLDHTSRSLEKEQNRYGDQ